MSEAIAQDQYISFCGPLPKEAYDAVTAEFNLFRQDRVAELAARALYGQAKAKEHIDELESRIADSQIDELTGVLRRDPTYHQLQDLISGIELKRRGTDLNEGLAVFVLDVEEFKKINDEKGWTKGNTALRLVGQSLQGIARLSKGDIIGRIGGDEFVLIARYRSDETNIRGLLDSIEDRIRYTAPTNSHLLPSLKWHHAFYQDGDDAESLINRAYPKGDNEEAARSHRQSGIEYYQKKEQAIAASLPNMSRPS